MFIAFVYNLLEVCRHNQLLMPSFPAGFAAMAGLPAAFGLYSCAAAICGYTLVGSSKYLVGCTSASLASTAASLASTAGHEQLLQLVCAWQQTKPAGQDLQEVQQLMHTFCLPRIANMQVLSKLAVQRGPQAAATCVLQLCPTCSRRGGYYVPAPLRQQLAC